MTIQQHLIKPTIMINVVNDMNESNIFVKEKQADLFAKGFILLALIVASLICCFAPLLFSGLIKSSFSFYFMGGLLFAFFTALYVRLLYKEFHPNNVIIISSRGFVDKKNIGPDIEIEWTNVASVKLLGNKDMPFLGITLENCDIVMAKMKKREADEMRENIDENLPHILIAQNEIYTPVNELKDVFVRLIREARVLNNESSQKNKSNPFTTDDVLRAFGKLPPNDSKNPEKENKQENINTDSESESVLETIDDIDALDVLSIYKNEDNTSNTNTDDNIKDVDVNDNSDDVVNTQDAQAVNTAEQYITSADSFYESIKNKFSSPNETDETATNTAETTQNELTAEKEIVSDIELSSEINEFLSRAKSSRITELNKILTEKDVPFSISRDADKNDAPTKETATENKVVEDVVAEETITNSGENSITLIADNLSDNDDENAPLEEIVEESEEISETFEETQSIETSTVAEQNDNEENTDINYNKDFYIEFPSELYEEKNEDDIDFTFESLIQQTKEFDTINPQENNENTDSE